jgi:DNA gyrase/topoisomerase IV subunit A
LPSWRTVPPVYTSPLFQEDPCGELPGVYNGPTMITSEKIDEWLQEAQERPESAVPILQYIANRLRDLTSRNEELRAENIALMTEKRVEEYERRIAYLEYQLDLLKRQLGGEPMPVEGPSASGQVLHAPVTDVANILIYDNHGRVLRSTITSEALVNGSTLGHISGDLPKDSDAIRLLITPPAEELLWIFDSGRIATMPVTSLAPAADFDWGQAQVPAEPRSREILVCVAPVSRMALAEYFLQASRRGFVKKIRSGMASSILANHYIGSGVKQPADRTFDLVLCSGEDRLALISQAGYLLLLDIKGLPFAIEEAMRLEAVDHLVAAFVAPAGRSIFAMTQIGKAIHLTEDRLNPVAGLRTKGQALFSQQRRQKGVRLVGAASINDNDWGIALHQDGELTLHEIHDLCDAGVIVAQSSLLAFTTFSPARP